MKHSIFSLTLSGFLLVAPGSHAGWGDLVKEVAKDPAAQQIQKQILETTVGSQSGTALDTETLIRGLKEALVVGSQRAIEEISQPGGYLNNADIRIPLPDQIDSVAKLLRKYGLSSQVDQFEESMNRAAEKAAPQATELIINSLRQMSIDDARKIYEGPDDAATRYFKEKTGDQLRSLFQPSVKESLNQVGATRYYGELAGEAKDIPFVGDKVNVDLDNYVTEEALNGLFNVLAQEEKKIRDNPAARTTELLKQVFQ